MIYTYSPSYQFKQKLTSVDEIAIIQEAEWIDLLNPSKEEEMLIEKIHGLNIPTREEMQEIELSSRLYKENGGLFMTVTMVAKSDSLQPSSDVVTLVLAHNKLITIRYFEPHSFALLISRVNKFAHEKPTAFDLFFEFIEVSVDRLADILEKVAFKLDNYSKDIFQIATHGDNATKPDYRTHLQTIASCGDLTAKVQESLITFNRLITFFDQTTSTTLLQALQIRLLTLGKDVTSLSDYVNFLSNKISFLLDATLGMVNIEQNNIIKIFSIAAVIFLPPTLVASMYGMNFHYMPELSFRWGYPLAIGMMLIAAWLPYKFFKMKKWL